MVMKSGEGHGMVWRRLGKVDMIVMRTVNLSGDLAVD